MSKKDPNKPVTVFAGKLWEALLLKSLLENAGIEAFLKDDAIGTLAPWYASPGGTAPVKVVIADSDLEQARQVVTDFEKNRTEEDIQ